jgi:hypothetical protein
MRASRSRLSGRPSVSPRVVGHADTVRDDQLQELAQQWAERTAAEQGLPPKIEDVAVLRRVLYLMGFLDLDGRPVRSLR